MMSAIDIDKLTISQRFQKGGNILEATEKYGIYDCNIQSNKLTIAFLCINMGIVTGWPSSTVNLFISPNTTLHRPMTETEIALLGSLQAVGAIIATPLAGCVLDGLGRKRSAILSSLTYVISWAMIAACNRVEVVLAAVLIAGIGGAVLLVASVYISEICQDSIRGAMTSAPMLCYYTGIMISYLLGGILQYHHLVYVCLSMSVLAVLVLGILKESPTTLMSKGFDKDAAKSIAFYRRKKTSSKEVMNEIDKIRRALNPDISEEMMLFSDEAENLKPNSNCERKSSPWQFFRKSSSTQRELVITLFLITAYVFQGFPIVQVFAEPLFMEAVPSDVMSANACSILTGVVAVISSVVAAYLVDVAGRRPLIVYSSAITGLCCIILGTQIHLQWGPKYLSAVFIYLYTIFYTVGAGTVAYVFLAEVFLPEVKSLMSMLAIEWSWFCSFLILFAFPPLLSAVGLAPIFYFFGIVCFATSLFCIFYMPETKGLPIDAIQKLFKPGQRRYWS